MEQKQPIERKETGIRLLLTVLFVLILRAIEVVLGAIVLFQLAFALITRRRPGVRVVTFANQVTTYVTQLLRYVTFQDDQRPFPFSDFPVEKSPHDSSGQATERTQASSQDFLSFTSH